MQFFKIISYVNSPPPVYLSAPAPFPGSHLFDPSFQLAVPRDFLGAALSRAELIHPFIHAGSRLRYSSVQFSSVQLSSVRFWFWFGFGCVCRSFRLQLGGVVGNCGRLLSGRGGVAFGERSHIAADRRQGGWLVGWMVRWLVGRVQSLRVPPCVYVIWH